MPQIAVRSLRICGGPQSLRLRLINAKSTRNEQESYMAASFLDFTKAVNITETVDIDKDIFTESFALFNSAIGNATADALGAWTHTQTLTETLAVQGVGSTSASESLSQANPVNFAFVDSFVA
jgi:hypothetical protein